MKFNQTQSSVSRVVSCGRTDGHDEADSRFTQVYELVYKCVTVYGEKVLCIFSTYDLLDHLAEKNYWFLITDTWIARRSSNPLQPPWMSYTEDSNDDTLCLGLRDVLKKLGVLNLYQLLSLGWGVVTYSLWSDGRRRCQLMVTGCLLYSFGIRTHVQDHRHCSVVVWVT